MRYVALAIGLLTGLLVSGPLHAQTALQELEGKVKAANEQGAFPPAKPGDPALPPAPGAVAPATPAAAEPGYLGVLADDRAGAGLKIIELTVGAPGEKAGLRAGDVVTSIDGRAIKSMQDFEPIMLASPPGSKLTFQVERDGQVQQVIVTLGQRPAPGERRFDFGRIPGADATAPGEPRAAVLGVRLATVTPEVQQAFSLPAPRGALIVDIVPGSPAEKAGLPVEAVVVFIDGKQIDTPTDVSRLVAEAGPGKEIKVAYFSRGQLAERKVTLDARPTDPLIVNRPLMESDRVQALERRVMELERRIAELEQMLKKQP